MAESFLFSIAESLIAKLASRTYEEASRVLGVYHHLIDLKQTLSLVKAVLLDADQKQFLHEITKGANLIALKKQLAHDELDYRVYNSPEYRDAYVSRLLQDESTAALIGLYKQYEHQNMLDVLQSDPDLSNIYTIGKILDESGISDEDLCRGLLSLDYSFGRSSVGYGLLFGAMSATGILGKLSGFLR